MRRRNNDYFKSLEHQVEFCLKAADFLLEILTNYSAENIAVQRKKMHEIEQKADDLHHEIVSKLIKEFITPIDQADILRLVQIIDDITDVLDEVTMNLYMFHVDIVPEAATILVKKVNQCVRAFIDVVGELKNFKKSDKLHQLVVKVHTIESEADIVYLEAIHQAFRPDSALRNIFGIKAVYDSLENCCDLCEKASNVIEETVMKNL